MEVAKASAVFGITAAPGHGIDVEGIGPLLKAEREGNFTFQARAFADGNSFTYPFADDTGKFNRQYLGACD